MPLIKAKKSNALSGNYKTLTVTVISTKRSHMTTNILKSYRSLLYGVIAVGITAGMFGTALAQMTPPAADTPAPVVLDISNDGTALLRGTVTEVNPDSIIVDSWGGTWTVRINDDGTVIPSATSTPTDTSGIAIGDFVGADGMIAGDAAFTIDASFVRNWTTDPLTGVFEETTAAEGTTTAPL